MKKFSFYLGVIFTCSFLTFSTPAASYSQLQSQVRIEYEVRDGEIYEVHYDEDGKVVLVQPME